MKHIRRLFITIILLLTAALIINAKTRFFQEIGTYIPYLDKHYPYVSEFISDISDDINEQLSKIPTPAELWADIRHVELPIDPDDIAANVYYSSDSMLNFYSGQNISVAISGRELDVYGVTHNVNEKHLVYRFLDSSGEMLDQYVDSVDADGQYRKILRIPDGSYQFAVFTGPERFGEFSSTVYNYVYLTQSADGSWSTAVSPVLEWNISAYEKDRSISAALKSTYAICSDTDTVKALAESITSGYSSDYDKALILHDWVCDSIYYDNDSINGSTNTAPYVATEVLSSKRAVCLGYANLYASLCRSLRIPCNVVTGYALGVIDGEDTEWNDTNLSATEANHAWNEVYLDNRWVIVDTTWDSRNKINGGTASKDGDTSHLYFDANIRFFSSNHKIFEYIKR